MFTWVPLLSPGVRVQCRPTEVRCMSSLHQDHLLVEGPEPVTGPRAPRAAARGTSRRPAEEKASTVPTQRQGKSQRSGTTPAVSAAAPAAARPRATGRKAAATAAGHLAARAKVAATTKASATTK